MSNTITNFIFDADDGTALGMRSITINGEPWFVAADVLTLLTLDRKALERLDEDEKGVSSIHTLGGEQQMTIVSESGLYSLILGSRKPEAKRFKRWVTGEVLPSIRKTGAYVGPDAQIAAGQQQTLFLSHAADIMVAADRAFRSAMRAGRSAGLSHAQAIRQANRVTVQKTGVDMLDELQAHDHLRTMEVHERGSGARHGWIGPQDEAALQFWTEYEGGGFQGGSCLPLMSTQAFALYRRWCRIKDLEPLNLARLIFVLVRSGKVRNKRKRYIGARGQLQGPVAFLIPAGPLDVPQHMTEAQYLGQCVSAVDAMLQPKG